MSVHKNGGAGQPGRDVPMGVKVIALMGRAGVSQAAIARKYGVGRSAVGRTVWGLRKGRRLRTAIARELGFNSWDELKAERVTL